MRRFKTKKEFTDEFGPNWRMPEIAFVPFQRRYDYLLGEYIHEIIIKDKKMFIGATEIEEWMTLEDPTDNRRTTLIIDRNRIDLRKDQNAFEVNTKGFKIPDQTNLKTGFESSALGNTVKDISNSDYIEEKGLRYNSRKLKWSLVNFQAMEPMVRVLELGAKKYSADNWKKGLDKKEILESMMRHLTLLMDGETHDKESGLLHIGHIQCNAMFWSYFYQQKEGVKSCETRQMLNDLKNSKLSGDGKSIITHP